MDASRKIDAFWPACGPHRGIARLSRDDNEGGRARLAEREYKPFEPTSNEELLKFFDEAVAASKAAILAMSDEDLHKDWTLRSGETVFFTLPKIGAVRAMVSGHGIHHRGQLSVYLRLNDIPVPSIYGPSADENAG